MSNSEWVHSHVDEGEVAAFVDRAYDHYRSIDEEVGILATINIAAHGGVALRRDYRYFVTEKHK